MEANRHLRDVNPRETFVLVTVLAVIVWIGIVPRPFLSVIEPAATAVNTLVQNERAAARPGAVPPAARLAHVARGASGARVAQHFTP